jgi:hypothetical protein
VQCSKLHVSPSAIMFLHLLAFERCRKIQLLVACAFIQLALAYLDNSCAGFVAALYDSLPPYIIHPTPS